jgi:ketosteroid isomerase-like protein
VAEQVPGFDPVEQLRQGIEAFNRHDFDAFVALWHPECEWRPLFATGAISNPYRGRDGVRRWITEVDELLEEFQVELNQVRYLGNGVGIASGRMRFRAKGSDAEQDAMVAWCFELRDELVIRGRAYSTLEGALTVAHALARSPDEADPSS